jgi:long-chain acyl-CoA synthetase
VREIHVPAVVAADPDANTTDLLLDRLRLTPELELFALPNGEGGWSTKTVREFYNEVVALAKGLMDAGVGPGDRIGFMCKTRYEWTLVDFAAWFAGAILVPIYETSAPAQIQYTLDNSEATWLIVETAEHFTRFDEVRSELPRIRQVWKLDLGDLDKLAKSGTAVSDDNLEKRRRHAVGSDIATLIYTSGSTGMPKGCVLTHSNFVELVRNAQVAMSDIVNTRSSTLLFITTAHIFARYISVLAVSGGVKIGHQADTKQLLPSLGSFKPTFLLAVPRVFEKVYNSAEQKAESGGKGAIFRKAAQTAVAYSQALDRGHVPFALRAQFAVFDRLVLSKLRSAMGGRVEYAVSGSAPLSPRLGHFYRSMGIRILEGYGLTETTAPATINLVDKFKIGTVGPPLPGVGLRIAEDGEVQVTGINVFEGYWNNPEATAEAFTDDGWFRTGDLGSIDDEGYVSIVGRKKEIIVTAGGKNVAPAQLEDPIRANPIRWWSRETKSRSCRH